MSRIAIITARGGSKRIPRKNIKYFSGKPIIEYSIKSAIESEMFSEVMVSTDDLEIAEIAKSLGAKVPFFRSNDNSNDYATTADVIYEVLCRYSELGMNFDSVCCIYPTAPFITPKKIINAFKMLELNNAFSVIPVVKYSFPIFRSFKKNLNGFIELNWPEFSNTRSQDLPPTYHDAGQFYCLNVPHFLKTKKIFTDKTIGFELPEIEVQDIDNEEDWGLAEFKFDYLSKLE